MSPDLLLYFKGTRIIMTVATGGLHLNINNHFGELAETSYSVIFLVRIVSALHLLSKPTHQLHLDLHQDVQIHNYCPISQRWYCMCQHPKKSISFITFTPRIITYKLYIVNISFSLTSGVSVVCVAFYPVDLLFLFYTFVVLHLLSK